MNWLRKVFDPRTLRFFMYFFRAYPTRTLMMIGLLILAGLAEGVGLATLLPVLEFATGQQQEGQSELTQYVVGAFNSVGIEPGLGILLVVVVVAMSLKGAFLWLAMKQVGYTMAQVATDLRLRLIRALIGARWSYFVRQPTGHFANALSSEANRASMAYRHACSALAGIIQVLVYLTVVVLVSWQVAVVAAAVGPLVMLGLKGLVRMGREGGDRQTDLMKDLVARITELLPGIKPVKAMAREGTIAPFLEEETEAFNEARRQTVLARETLSSFREPIIVLVLTVGLYGAVTVGSAAPSAVLVAAVLFYRVMTTIGNLQTQYQTVTVHESAFWSLLNKVEEAEEQQEGETEGRPAPPLADELVLEDVSFDYDGEAVLTSVNMTIPAGTLTTLVGPSGAGKTTLVDLICGLLTPGEGRILADGVPLAEIDRRQWRSQVGYVPQDPVLFHESIKRNITLGDEDITDDDVKRALQAAGIWEFVHASEGGMERTVGERGTQLSGGQKQRIAVARALVSRPRLLILDEATAALDPETEAEVCETLRELRGSTTMVAVSHQPAIRRVSDAVYSVVGGSLERIESEVGSFSGAGELSGDDVLYDPAG